MKVKELAALHEKWAERCGVLPWDAVSPGRAAKAARQASAQASKQAKDGLPGPVFPGKEWAVRTPSALGMDEAKREELAVARDALTREGRGARASRRGG